MRWLLDQGLPRTTVVLLKDAGYEALHVGDVGLASAADQQIIAYATKKDFMIVTLDADFHSILAQFASTRPTVLRIREEGLKAQELCRLIVSISIRFRPVLEAGCVMTYHRGLIRYRNLPLV